jgi:hypothetical protein
MCRGRDRMVAGFKTTCAISAYHHYVQLRVRISLRRGVLDTSLCDRVWQ